ncbi:RecX family transcriptional regulator [Methylobacterium oryzae CBMB20]
MDDARFADTRLATLRRRGTSSRGVSAKLAAKGVPRDVVEAAMQAERDAASGRRGRRPSSEQAAQAYAKRRRLGPYRRPGSAGGVTATATSRPWRGPASPTISPAGWSTASRTGRTSSA